MKIKTFPVNPFEMNCYICHCEETNEGVIIDPGIYTDEEKSMILKYVEDNKINIKYILDTHGHIDHIMGNKWAKDTFNVPLYIHKDDMQLIKNAPVQGQMFGINIDVQPEPDKYIDENDKIEFGNITFDIIHTPGHSPGGVCYIDKTSKTIIAGDCLFKESIGRTDLWMGDMDTLLDSIKNKILTYPDDYRVYPGHYDSTTVGEEKNTNPFLIDEY
jgi:glyoxylase-like metal-dependent hydrolase (beta-lactamase superfamily II)